MMTRIMTLMMTLGFVRAFEKWRSQIGKMLFSGSNFLFEKLDVIKGKMALLAVHFPLPLAVDVGAGHQDDLAFLYTTKRKPH